MSRLPKSPKAKAWLIAAGTLIILIVFVAIRSPQAAESAMRHGDSFSDPAHALVWYQVAASLSPTNHQILNKLAAADLATNHPQAALAAATRSYKHSGGNEALVLKSQAELELNQTDAAIANANQAVQNSTNDQAAQIQLGLAYAEAGKGTKFNEMIALLGHSEAAQTLSGLDINHLALAQELYARGLLNSSERVLDKYPVDNSQYYLLKARLALQLYHKKGLQESRGLLLKGIAISPERIDLRQMLVTIDQKLKNQSEANQQGSKIQDLAAGKV